MLLRIENIGVVEFPDKPNDNYIPKTRQLEDGSVEGYWEQVIPSIEELRQKGLAYYKQKTELFKQQKFVYTLNIATGGTINVSTDMTEKTLNDWVLVLLAGTNMAHVIDADTGLDAYVPVTNDEIQTAKGYLAQKLIAITSLDVKISNKIKTASNELIIRVFTLSPEQLEHFSTAIMFNAENVLQMNDEQFDNFIDGLLNNN